MKSASEGIKIFTLQISVAFLMMTYFSPAVFLTAYPPTTIMLRSVSHGLSISLLSFSFYQFYTYSRVHIYIFSNKLSKSTVLTKSNKVSLHHMTVDARLIV
ncbi:Uncharacterized protein TCM_020400 [Theobroma cacao]|uniref:Uncharacterized protein n=1 Tax=Theobroma cacao TaxID=3641 RepID=A0A061EK17_THECC|nr:Uncharacterized protein TCM_020400 [Theobroma cacao]